ncbi:LETM1 domain-containing protein 1 [Nilaparvata lugens]|uniref:LETM1 domain-containing protein 1 n=1 Tax=Nilaparvata lugens TaxID=108931 RepID=UPI00193DE734|nr:LETM1 domain-containing protein 1 [Nilaparvata lugens]
MYFLCSKLICRSTIINSQLRSLRKLHDQNEKRKKMQLQALSRYMEFIKRYTDILDKNFPTAMRLYRQFTYGVKVWPLDIKTFYLIHSEFESNSTNISIKKYHGEALVHQVIVGSSHNMTIPSQPGLFKFLSNRRYLKTATYYFPRQLLTRHFWSLQQRSEFAIMVQRKKLRWYKPVFRSLQAQLEVLQSHPCHKDWEYVIRLLGSGLHPSPTTIIKCKPLFAESPYHLRRLYQSHARALLKMHDMHTGWRRRTRLAERAEFLQLMDQAILREGGVNRLTIEELKWACSIRGLSPTNMKTEDMITWLNAWLTISKEVDEHSYSLLLHCPILLSYNHPSNWVIR